MKNLLTFTWNPDARSFSMRRLSISPTSSGVERSSYAEFSANLPTCFRV
jgi:hypothetical protein